MIEPLIALVALCLMEIVLGIDNIVFISILSSKLPADQQSAGRKLGLLLALGTRILLLACVFWIAQLTGPIFKLTAIAPIQPLQSYFMVEIPEYLLDVVGEQNDEGNATHPIQATGERSDPAKLDSADSDSPTSNDAKREDTEHEDTEPEKVLDQEAWNEFIEISWRDLILIAGGMFLIYNSVSEIHEEVEDDHGEEKIAARRAVPRFGAVLIQIALMDIVFSLDSVITAVGMADELWVMITAVVIAVGVMIVFANQVGNFVQNNPTIKMLALSFLLLIGVMLVAEGIGTPIAKGYIYFAMAFSLFVEAFNLRIRKRSQTATTS